MTLLSISKRKVDLVGKGLILFWRKYEISMWERFNEKTEQRELLQKKKKVGRIDKMEPSLF